jgi:hypothetical protein
MSDTSEGAPSPAEVSIRRAPKIPVFLVLGAVLGAVATLILTSLQPTDPAVGFFALFGYLCVYGVPFGAAVGGTIAILLDRRASKHAGRLTAEHYTVVDAPPESAATPAPQSVVLPDAAAPDAGVRPEDGQPQARP